MKKVKTITIEDLGDSAALHIKTHDGIEYCMSIARVQAEEPPEEKEEKETEEKPAEKSEDTGKDTQKSD